MTFHTMHKMGLYVIFISECLKGGKECPGSPMIVKTLGWLKSIVSMPSSISFLAWPAHVSAKQYKVQIIISNLAAYLGIAVYSHHLLLWM